MNKPCFIAVTNRNLCKRPFFDVIEDLSKKDVKTIVLREKDLSEEEYYEIAEKCKEICDRNGASLTIHNFYRCGKKTWNQEDSSSISGIFKRSGESV